MLEPTMDLFPIVFGPSLCLGLLLTYYHLFDLVLSNA